MSKIVKNKLGNFSIILLIFVIVGAWMFSGWPQIWKNPELPQQIKTTEAASGDVILLWNTANGPVPSGWACISCNPGEDFYGVFPRAAASYGGSTAGSDTHSHNLTFVGATEGASSNGKGNTGGTSRSTINTHTHSWPNIVSGNGESRPPFKNLNFIKANNPTEIPANIIAIFDTTSLPSGWTRYDTLDGLYLRGFSDNANGGSMTHNHPTGVVTSGSSPATLTDTGSGSTNADTHTNSLPTSALSNENNNPPYVEVIFAYNSSGSSVPIPTGLVAFFDSTLSSEWTMVSDNAPWNGNFLKGAANFGSTGGSIVAHNHGGSISLTSGTPSATRSNQGTTGTYTAAASNHTHYVTYNISSYNVLPVYRDVILAKKNPPTGPSFTQNDWRWYDNADNVQPGSAKADESVSILGVTNGEILRIRMNIVVGTSDLTAGVQSFKLQYGQGDDCSSVSWNDVDSISGSGIWRGYNNNTPADGATIDSNLLSLSTVPESYEEENPSNLNPNAIPINGQGEWDWVIENNNAFLNTTYCFRMIRGDGTALNNYNSDSYPKLTTAGPLPADWLADENTSTAIARGEIIRLRIQVTNSGLATSSDYLLEYATKTQPLCKDNIFNAVPTTNTGLPFVMATSSNVANNDPTSMQLSNPGYSATSGEIVAYSSNSSGVFFLDFEEYTEFEFVFKAVNTASGPYCFRLTDAGEFLDEYLAYPELTITP